MEFSSSVSSELFYKEFSLAAAEASFGSSEGYRTMTLLFFLSLICCAVYCSFHRIGLARMCVSGIDKLIIQVESKVKLAR